MDNQIQKFNIEDNKSFNGAYYHQDTEVYTKRGWVFFKDLLDNDIIYSLNLNTYQAEWNKIVKREVVFCTVNLIGFSTSKIQFLVNSEHKIPNIKDIECSDLNTIIPANVEFCSMGSISQYLYDNQQDESKNKIKQIVAAPLVIQRKKIFEKPEYAQLFGYFLGNTKTSLMVLNELESTIEFKICQKSQIRFFQDVCKKLNIKLNSCGNKIYKICDKNFVNLLKTCYVLDKNERCISEDVFNDSLENRLNILKGLEISDLYISGSYSNYFECKNKKLRDDIEKLIITCGLEVRTYEIIDTNTRQAPKIIINTIYGIKWNYYKIAMANFQEIITSSYTGNLYGIVLEQNQNILIRHNYCTQFI